MITNIKKLTISERKIELLAKFIINILIGKF